MLGGRRALQVTGKGCEACSVQSAECSADEAWLARLIRIECRGGGVDKECGFPRAGPYVTSDANREE